MERAEPPGFPPGAHDEGVVVKKGHRRYPGWRWLLFLLVPAVIIAAGGFMINAYFRHEARRDSGCLLSHIADFKAEQIGDWIREYLDDARALASNPYLHKALVGFLEDPGSTPAADELLCWMEDYVETENYRELFLIDTDGKVLLSTSTRGIAGTSARKMAAEALAEGEPCFSDLTFDSIVPDIHIDLILPILRSTPEGEKPLGTLLLRIDPYDFLYPLIQSQPTPDRTMETLLVRKEGEEVCWSTTW
jgi:hypothetical protein